MHASSLANSHPHHMPSGLTFDQQQYLHQPYNASLPSPQSAHSYTSDQPFAYYDSALISDALALLQQRANLRMNNDPFTAPHPNIRVQTSTPLSVPDLDSRHDPVVPFGASSDFDWQMYQSSMGGPTFAYSQGLKRGREHQRTPSASTVASAGPASPYPYNTFHPQIANTDFSPDSPAYYGEQNLYTKNLPTPTGTPIQFAASGYLPSAAAHTPAAHQAMKAFAIDHHISDNFTPEFYQFGASMSGYDNDNESPATPQSGAGESTDARHYNMPSNDFRQANPNVQLFRTESQAYQDELYNPPVTTYTSTPATAAKPANTFLSPHRNLVTERLQTANIARAQSPVSGVSRERSPFRDGAPLAPAGGWRSPGAGVGTAASMRQHQKEQAEQAEYAQHRPQLQRERTKTISPKDALLDYNDQDQAPLFQDTIPAGYKQHNGGVEQWPRSFVNQPGSSFGSLQTPAQAPTTSFRAASANGYSGSDAFGYVPLQPTSGVDQSQASTASYPIASYAGPKMGSYLTASDANPPFPATLTSMESSVSDSGLPASSQDSQAPQRPADTRANTGTYTCTYHGCTQRFDTPANLQKHKRDFHRSHQQQQHHQQQQQQQQAAAQTQEQVPTDDSAASSGTASASPRSSVSPAPSSTGMTSAALLARNSQAGPHKCTRINPSTNKPCNTIFSRPYDLTRHEDTIHNGRKQKVRCPMCREEKTFSRNDALTRHMRVVHPEADNFGKRGRRGD